MTPDRHLRGEGHGPAACTAGVVTARVVVRGGRSSLHPREEPSKLCALAASRRAQADGRFTACGSAGTSASGWLSSARAGLAVLGKGRGLAVLGRGGEALHHRLATHLVQPPREAGAVLEQHGAVRLANDRLECQLLEVASRACTAPRSRTGEQPADGRLTPHRERLAVEHLLTQTLEGSASLSLAPCATPARPPSTDAPSGAMGQRTADAADAAAADTHATAAAAAAALAIG